MAIYRKKASGGTWYFSVYAGPNRPRLRGSCGTTNRAEALLIEQTMRVAAGKRTPKEHILRLIDVLYADDKPLDLIPLDAAFFEVERIMRLNNREIARASMNHKRRSIARLKDWTAFNWPSAQNVQDVDRTCAQAFVAYLQKQGLKPKSVFNVSSDLGACWNILKRAHDGLENPWPLASPMEHKSERREAFTREEVAAIFAAADKIGHDWPKVARIGACTGLRYVDIALLKHSEIENGAIVTEPIKTKRYGIAVCLPLPQDILDLIGTGTGYIFPEHAKCYKASKRMPVGVRFSDVLRTAGIDSDRYDFHCFRHYFRTCLAAAGISDETAMRLGGWTQRDTAARYDHDTHREELAAAIATAWKECKKTRGKGYHTQAARPNNPQKE